MGYEFNFLTSSAILTHSSLEFPNETHIFGISGVELV